MPKDTTPILPVSAVTNVPQSILPLVIPQTILNDEDEELETGEELQFDIPTIRTEYMDTRKDTDRLAIIPASPPSLLDFSGLTPVASLTPQTGGVLLGYPHQNPEQRQTEIVAFVNKYWPRTEREGRSLEERIKQLRQYPDYPACIKPFHLYAALKEIGVQISKSTVNRAFRSYKAANVRLEVAEWVNANKNWLIQTDNNVQTRVQCLLQLIKDQDPQLRDSLNPLELTAALRNAEIRKGVSISNVCRAFQQANICPRVEVMAFIKEHWPKLDTALRPKNKKNKKLPRCKTDKTLLKEKLQTLLRQMKQRDPKLLASLEAPELVVALYEETREDLIEQMARDALKAIRKANTKDTTFPPHNTTHSLQKKHPHTAPVPAPDAIQLPRTITGINHPMPDMPLIRHSTPREPTIASALGLFSSQQGCLRDHSGAKRQHNLLTATVEVQPQPKRSREVGINSSKKRYEALSIIQTFQADKANPLFSHNISEVNKKPLHLVSGELSQKYNNIWYMKEGQTQTNLREVIAQEFFRLIIPTHPKTRLVVIHSAEKKTYVLSKQIPGFTSFQDLDPLLIKQNIKEHTYKGLGEVLVVSLWMNEIDLKPANIGIDHQNNIIKIDGGWCFARLKGGGFSKWNYTIREEDISLLPFLRSYEAYNWLDAITERACRIDYKSIDQSISIDPQFRNEVNQALLKILVLPDEFIKKFVDVYLPEGENNLIYNEIINRRNALKAAALENDSFNQYLGSNAPTNSVHEYIHYLSNFKTTQKNSLEVIDLYKKVTDQFLYQLILPVDGLREFQPSPNQSPAYKKSL